MTGRAGGELLPVYIGISARFRVIEGLTAGSIRRNTDAPVEIIHLYPEVEAGCTGFSNVRFSIRRGIYLDCDQIVLGDIVELMGYHVPGHFVCLADGSTEVAVIDCEHACQNKREEHLLPKLARIPLVWNSEDQVVAGAKLVHFTNLSTQPWFAHHPDAAARAIYQEYRP